MYYLRFYSDTNAECKDVSGTDKCACKDTFKKDGAVCVSLHIIIEDFY